MKRICIVGYFLSWMAATALLAYVPLALVWEGARRTLRHGIDDGVAALALPVGAALGAWAAARIRPGRKGRLTFLTIGVALILTGAWLTWASLDASDRAKGSGPFAGLGELAFAGMTIVLGIFGACVFGIGMFGTLARFPESAGGDRLRE